jgi:hypothetical protein
MSDDVASESDPIFYRHQAVRCRSSFDFEVIAIDAELTLRSEIVSSDVTLVGIVIWRVTPCSMRSPAIFKSYRLAPVALPVIEVSRKWEPT